MRRHTTATARDQAAKNAAITGIALLVVWCVITAAVVLICKQPISRSFRLTLVPICAVALFGFLASWLYGHSVGGRILLDCGPAPGRWQFLLSAGLSVLMVLMAGLDPILKWIDGPDATWETLLFDMPWPLLLIAALPYELIMASGRLQVRENGSWQYASLRRWSKIGSYRWAKDGTLLIRPKGFFSWSQGALPVPRKHTQAFDELLAKNCPNVADA
jgi:hypothetical protein